jgi:hypothetical protein
LVIEVLQEPHEEGRGRAWLDSLAFLEALSYKLEQVGLTAVALIVVLNSVREELKGGEATNIESLSNLSVSSAIDFGYVHFTRQLLRKNLVGRFQSLAVTTPRGVVLH